MITGRVAKLKVGYQTAVEIRNWCLTYGHEVVGRLGISIDGIVTNIDPYWSRQRPLDLWVQMDETFWWVWTGGITLNGVLKVNTRLTATGQGQPTVKLVPAKAGANGQTGPIRTGR